MVTTLQADRITAINHIFLMCRSGPSWIDILEAVSEPAALNAELACEANQKIADRAIRYVQREKRRQVHLIG
jgi:hypothetical protein